MTRKASNVLAMLGKRMLGFKSSSTGCCATTPSDRENAGVGADAIGVPAAEAKGPAASCCAAARKGAGEQSNSPQDSAAHK